MSLWTPDGERPVQKSSANPKIEVTDELAEALAAAGLDINELGPEQIAEAQAMLAEMGRVRQEMLAVPAAEIVANHLMGIYELGAIHLGENPPNFAEASVAIETLRAVLERLEGKFGEAEAVLRQALAQLQQAFVQLKEQLEAAAKPEPGVAAND
ncbi:MAG: hypothetical protein GX868_17620 [Actinobacteria bacterium]|nr:hypothetical protein [Actinomycetota bacterium]